MASPTGTAALLGTDGAPRLSADTVVDDRDGCRSECRALVAAIWITAVAFTCGMAMADPDLWGHTLYGLRAIELGVLTERSDPFSYTAPGAVWVNHEWLTEYQYGWLYREFGNDGLWWWRTGLVVVLFGVVAAALKRNRAGLAATACLLVFGAEVLSEFATFIRPQIATFVLFAVTLELLRRYWERPDWRLPIALPALTALWVNLHGGFLAGLGLQGVFLTGACLRWLREPVRRRETFVLAGVFAASGIATLVNPYGAGLHEMLWHHLWEDQLVREWQPIWAVSQSPVYYAPFGLIVLALPGMTRKNAIDLVVLAVVGWKAAIHLRHVALLCVAAMILLPAPLTRSLTRLLPTLVARWSAPGKRIHRRFAIACLVLVMLAIHARGSRAMWARGVRPWQIAVACRGDVPGMPVSAMSLMRREGIAGNILTDYGWGQFVLWHLFPDVKVGFDGRYRTVYSKQLERDLVAFQLADRTMPAATPLLDEHPTEIVLLPTDRGPHDYLASRPDWVRIAGNEQWRMYVADLPRFARVIEASRRGERSNPTCDEWQVITGRLGE